MRVSYRNIANKCIFVTQCAVDLLATSDLLPYILPSCRSCDFNVTVSEATHQSFQLAEGDGGTVEEIGRKPALVLITMSNGCAWEGGERESWETDCSWERRLEASFIYCHYYMVISWAAWKNHHTERSLGTGNCCRETKLRPGPPDPSLDGLRAAVIDYWEMEQEGEKRDRGRWWG